ncbi:MAG: DUF4102 domain-containing protein [Acidobacteria bacterium]|nr:DUF4102 domain-containing protein [Acidobacteriota bacterium]
MGRRVTLQATPRGRKPRGRHPKQALSTAFVRNVAQVGRYCDGNGLYLEVKPTGTRSWVQRLAIRGRRRELGLGGFPLVPLKEARAQALANRRLARAGGDPLAEKRRARSMPTFADAAERVWNQMQPGWRNQKHIQNWISGLRRFAFPRLGKIPVSEVSSADLVEALRPVWHVRPATARRVRQRIGTVMEWAVAMEYRNDNPCDRIGPALGPQRDLVQHMRALPHAEVAAAITMVRATAATAPVKLAFEFLVLTAARSGEVRGALWTEIDLTDRLWTIPPTRMKATREHRVPLSGRAMEILDAARTLNAGDPLVFPGQGGKPISQMRLPKLLQNHGIAAVPHGFRSSFRDWAAEETDHPREVVEAALAHAVGNRTEAAYARSDLFERRRRLMDDWSAYVGGGAGAPADDRPS